MVLQNFQGGPKILLLSPFPSQLVWFSAQIIISLFFSSAYVAVEITRVYKMHRFSLWRTDSNEASGITWVPPPLVGLLVPHVFEPFLSKSCLKFYSVNLRKIFEEIGFVHSFWEDCCLLGVREGQEEIMKLFNHKGIW